jgi:cellulase
VERRISLSPKSSREATIWSEQKHWLYILLKEIKARSFICPVIKVSKAIASGVSPSLRKLVNIAPGGTKGLPVGVKIPGAYSAKDPGILVNIYQNLKVYTPPGPKVWNGKSET